MGKRLVLISFALFLIFIIYTSATLQNLYFADGRPYDGILNATMWNTTNSGTCGGYCAPETNEYKLSSLPYENAIRLYDAISGTHDQPDTGNVDLWTRLDTSMTMSKNISFNISLVSEHNGAGCSDASNNCNSSAYIYAVDFDGNDSDGGSGCLLGADLTQFTGIQLYNWTNKDYIQTAPFLGQTIYRLFYHASNTSVDIYENGTFMKNVGVSSLSSFSLCWVIKAYRNCPTGTCNPLTQMKLDYVNDTYTETSTNTVPTPSNLTFLPTGTAYYNSTLNCTINMSDPELSNDLRIRWEWWKNSANQTSYGGTITNGLANGMVSGTNIDISTPLTRNDTWNCTIYVGDPTEYNVSAVSFAKNITNVPPTNSTVTDSSTSTTPANVGQDINFSALISDPDVSDTVTLIICNETGLTGLTCDHEQFCRYPAAFGAEGTASCNYTTLSTNAWHMNYSAYFVDASLGTTLATYKGSFYVNIGTPTINYNLTFYSNGTQTPDLKNVKNLDLFFQVNATDSETFADIRNATVTLPNSSIIYLTNFSSCYENECNSSVFNAGVKGRYNISFFAFDSGGALTTSSSNLYVGDDLITMLSYNFNPSNPYFNDNATSFVNVSSLTYPLANASVNSTLPDGTVIMDNMATCLMYDLGYYQCNSTNKTFSNVSGNYIQRWEFTTIFGNKSSVVASYPIISAFGYTPLEKNTSMVRTGDNFTFDITIWDSKVNTNTSVRLGWIMDDEKEKSQDGINYDFDINITVNNTEFDKNATANLNLSTVLQNTGRIFHVNVMDINRSLRNATRTGTFFIDLLYDDGSYNRTTINFVYGVHPPAGNFTWMTSSGAVCSSSNRLCNLYLTSPVGIAQTYSFKLKNSGAREINSINVSLQNSLSGWVSVSPISGDLALNDIIDVDLSIAPTSTGLKEGSLIASGIADAFGTPITYELPFIRVNGLLPEGGTTGTGGGGGGGGGGEPVTITFSNLSTQLSALGALCGNGKCDVGEDYNSCRKDCPINLESIFCINSDLKFDFKSPSCVFVQAPFLIYILIGIILLIVAAIVEGQKKKKRKRHGS